MEVDALFAAEVVAVYPEEVGVAALQGEGLGCRGAVGGLETEEEGGEKGG